MKTELMNNLKDIREDNDITQKEIALILNTSQPNYSRWENHEKIIPLNKLNEICNYFKINMDYVLGLTKVRKEMHNENRINQEIIGLNFKNLRLKNNLTQKELASFLNTTQSVISAYENGKTLILTSFALQICLKYKASLDELCNRK